MLHRSAVRLILVGGLALSLACGNSSSPGARGSGGAGDTGGIGGAGGAHPAAPDSSDGTAGEQANDAAASDASRNVEPPPVSSGSDAAEASSRVADASTDAASSPMVTYPSPSCLARADALVAQMTATEKYAQMMQVERAVLTPELETQYDFGSVYSQGSSGPAINSPSAWADMAEGYRQAALASRLKIPIIYGADEVHGVGTVRGATIFPHNIGLGATRDAELVQRIGAVTAAEALGTGVDFLFSPVVAVALDERWGRTYEAFGETTDLASTMGVALIKGLQFTTSGAPTGILANAKHYIGDGGTTNGVNGGLTAGDEQALRAIHLAPYRAAVAAHVGAIMASYNSWQGVKSHVNHAMLTDLLKGELGFGGFVNSDFDACFQLGVPEETGLGQCINAGVDMFMFFRATIPVMLGYFDALVKAGTVPPARIDDAVRRIVAVKCEMGLFAGSGQVDRTLTAQVGSAEHRVLAREAVQKSLVVLKNDGNVLPISKAETVIALAGKSADNSGNQAGGWTISWQGASGNDVTGATTIRQALETAVGANHVLYSLAGTSTQNARIGIAVIGETPYAEGKGDRTSLELDDADVAAVRALHRVGLKTVVVLIAGRPMLLDRILLDADAIVFAGLPGSEGAGVTDVLLGDAHPSGKLPHTWPNSIAQIPINFGDASYMPRFPYGLGLTY